MIYILISITLLAAMSPGPDLIVVMKNAIYGKKQGYFTALGVASAILVHITYCIAGIGLIISQSIMLFQIIKILGALYLIYLSYCLLKSKTNTSLKAEKVNKISNFGAFKEGFITNIMNPKATIFFLSVFTQVISPDTSTLTQGIYGLIMACTVAVWFSLFTTMINFSIIQKAIIKFQNQINKTFGILLGILGVKILFSKQ